MSPDYSLEQQALARYGAPIAGVDEAGRGPLAGPVVAAAVILNPGNLPPGLNDSKKLSEIQRNRLYNEIMNSSSVGIGIIEVEQIDRENILNATLAAMQSALEALSTSPHIALIDGNKCPQMTFPCQSVIKGDQKSLSIAAASIMAKVTRDKIMYELDHSYPVFGWAKNKGYGTKAHRLALSAHGVTPHHRRSFKPVADCL